MTPEERYSKFNNVIDLVIEYNNNLHTFKDAEYLKDCEKAYKKRYCELKNLEDK